MGFFNGLGLVAGWLGNFGSGLKDRCLFCMFLSGIRSCNCQTVFNAHAEFNKNMLGTQFNYFVGPRRSPVHPAKIAA